MRSQQCVAFLLQQGRANTYNISGGIDAWSRLVDARVPTY
jgi:rhodanese-related sulfurtransferase